MIQMDDLMVEAVPYATNTCFQDYIEVEASGVRKLSSFCGKKIGGTTPMKELERNCPTEDDLAKVCTQAPYSVTHTCQICALDICEQQWTHQTSEGTFPVSNDFVYMHTLTSAYVHSVGRAIQMHHHPSCVFNPHL